MASRRVEMTAEIVAEAIELAVEGKTKLLDYYDIKQPYWVLRVRGHAASWLVKTRTRTVKIGSTIPPAKAANIPESRRRVDAASDGFLGLRDAQKLARKKWAELDERPQTQIAPETPGWTWGKLVTEYRTYLGEMREDASGKPIFPSEDTQNDARLLFARPEVSEHENKRLADLDEEWFEGVQAKLHGRKTGGFTAYRKFRAYAQAALTWAATYKRRESGLTGRRWWLAAEKRQRTDKEVRAKRQRQTALQKKKENFKVEHLGQLLAEHERFCACRTGNARVSPSVRWGLWWDALTGHRRGSGTWIALEDVQYKDPNGKAGWGLATWQAEVMKAQNDFTLPMPPLGLHIIDCCMRDWKKAAAERKKPIARVSKWVFASRVTSIGDVAVSGSALANHLRSLRGLRQGNHRDVLRGIPLFSMHIIRSTLGDFILDHTELPPGTASLMIGHEIAGDRRDELDRVGRTGKRWYFQAQRIPEKTAAMEKWSEALLRAYFAAGGRYPE
ncbi:hypothetical protein QA649_37035 [Bradyrhizobium sp. CB1717]|uniref:hypothetical protein n=1 Tax=Bradyrhizobium sp. CB1717 TaxID=3039154 RepID=UPI0024B1A777|nr:hypothetical protein [Bradyrhizobium sp. CB1717]WFU23567.1 hypothetical protein QA649_37035 [Bradyrhizobium sp. CB1717]